MPVIRWVSASLGLLACLLLPVPLVARQAPSPPPSSSEALRVFLDCNAFCDFDHLRREITYVNWVRDRQDADIHLLITSQRTGGGGQQYTMKYIGLRGFQGTDDELIFSTGQTDTQDEIRRVVSQRIGLGLARYAARGALASRLRITYTAPEGAPAGAQQAKDPWNFWVFTAGVNGNLFGESQSKSNSISGSLSARRITEKWKFRANFGGSRNNSEFKLSADEVFKSRTSRYNVSALLVRSLGEHWSFGVDTRALRSTVDNFNLSLRVAPGIEYDVFPYKESSRRQFVVVYSAGLDQANYRDSTIFNRLRETHPIQSLTAALETTQQWGSLQASVSGSNYLNDWSKNRLSLSGGANIRIVRGLSFDFFGSYSRVRDQLSLQKQGATDEEVLLRLKQLKTSYFYSAFMGLEYTFGSKFNNVVNPRFSSSGGGSCHCSGGMCFCN